MSEDQVMPLGQLDKAKLVEAVQTALNCFRGMYDAIENGADADDLHNDPSYWPLSLLRVALGTVDETAGENWKDGQYIGPPQDDDEGDEE